MYANIRFIQIVILLFTVSLVLAQPEPEQIAKAPGQWYSLVSGADSLYHHTTLESLPFGINTGFSIAGDSLSITDHAGTRTVNLIDYLDNQGVDTFQFVPPSYIIISIQGDGKPADTIDIAPINTDNQVITDLSIVNDSLSMTIEDGNTSKVDLSPYDPEIVLSSPDTNQLDIARANHIHTVNYEVIILGDDSLFYVPVQPDGAEIQSIDHLAITEDDSLEISLTLSEDTSTVFLSGIATEPEKEIQIITGDSIVIQDFTVPPGNSSFLIYDGPSLLSPVDSLTHHSQVMRPDSLGQTFKFKFRTNAKITLFLVDNLFMSQLAIWANSRYDRRADCRAWQKYSNDSRRVYRHECGLLDFTRRLERFNNR